MTWTVFVTIGLLGVLGGIVGSVGITYLTSKSRASEKRFQTESELIRLCKVVTELERQFSALSDPSEVDAVQVQLAAIYGVIRKKITRDRFGKVYKQISGVVDLVEVICHLRLFLHAVTKSERMLAAQEVCKKDPQALDDLHATLTGCNVLRPLYSEEIAGIKTFSDDWRR